MTILTKDFALQLKAAPDETRSFEGYGSVFGNVDADREIVMPGAFVESLARQKREGGGPAMLWQHDRREPIGIWEDMAEDAKGLWVKGQLLTGVRAADETYIRLKAGAVRGLSIGYDVLASEPDRERNAVKLTKLDLIEVSVVTFPANSRARVDSVKSVGDRLEAFARRVRDGDPPAIKEFEDVLREAGIPRSMATAIAGRGYAKAIRSDSGSETATRALAGLAAALKGFSLPKI